MKTAILITVGLIIGIIIGIILKIFNINKYHREVVETLVANMQIENDYARELGYNSLIECMIDKKGIDYASYYYGNIYHLLSGIKQKDAIEEEITNQLGSFLSNVFKKDIELYKEKKKEKRGI